MQVVDADRVAVVRVARLADEVDVLARMNDACKEQLLFARSTTKGAAGEPIHEIAAGRQAVP